MKQILVMASVIAVIAASPTLAAAEGHKDTGFYAGLNYNYIKADLVTEAKPYVADSFNAVNPYMGYNVNQYVAVEGGISVSDSPDKTSPDGLAETSTSLYGINLDLVGKLPVINNTTLLASVGYVWSQMSIDLTDIGAAQTYTADGSADGYRLGLGAQVDVYNGLYIRGMGYYEDPGFAGINQATIASVGLGYTF